ncbi:MAG: hypothetical protein L5657_05390 [Calditerricola sp.]|nr:hypothetical protein [Calditerricola sp.]
MARLIDVLFSNIWLLIALYWLLLFLFPERRQQAKRRAEPRQSGSLASPPATRDPVPPGGAPIDRPDGPALPAPPPAGPRHVPVASPHPPTATAPQNAADAEGPRPVRKGRDGTARPADAPLALPLSADAVVAGILWAQVLHAPRAKAPHPLVRGARPRMGDER